jgi:short subunit fatty acids transporter
MEMANPFAKKRYLIAAIVGLLAPILLIYFYSSRAFNLYDAALFLSAIYLFYTFKTMLAGRFNFNRVNFIFLFAVFRDPTHPVQYLKE